MAELRGDVSILSFPDLLQHLASSHRSGILSITQGLMDKKIYMSPEGMRLLSTSTRKTSSLGEILIRTRKISRAELDQLLLQQHKTGRRLGEIVSRQGIVTKQDIETALREQAQEEVYDLFSWLDARFEFVEAPPPPKEADFPLSEVVVDANPTSIMLEAARRADELAVIMKELQDERMIPIRTNRTFSPDEQSLNPDLMSSVYGQVNGRVSIAEVVRLSLYPRFEALRAMYVLSQTEHVKVMDREGATMVHLKADTSKFPSSSDSKTPTRSPYAVPPGLRRSILLLGDMLKYRQALATLLRDSGYEVLEYSPMQAVQLFAQKRRVDCVILDVGLTSPDQYQFVQWLCENTRAPIVVLSSDASKEAAQAAIRKGARAFVVKPFTRETMLRTLSGVFQPSSTAVPLARGSLLPGSPAAEPKEP